MLRPSPRPRGFPGRAGAPGTLAAGSGRAARLPRPRPAAPVSDDASAETPTRPPVSAARFHFSSPCPAWGAGLSPPHIPTGVGTGALPAVGRGRRRGYDGAARPRTGPSSPRPRWHRGWGRAVPRRREIDPLPREGRDQIQAQLGAERAATTPTPLPGRAVRGPGGAARSGRRGRAAGSAPSHRVLSAVTTSRPARGGELGWREGEGYSGEAAPRGHVAWSEPSLRGRVVAPRFSASSLRGRTGADVSTRLSAARFGGVGRGVGAAPGGRDGNCSSRPSAGRGAPWGPHSNRGFSSAWVLFLCGGSLA